MKVKPEDVAWILANASGVTRVAAVAAVRRHGGDIPAAMQELTRY